MHMVVLGAHPDDGETGCGGVIALAVERGHEVTLLHLSLEAKDRLIEGVPERDVRRAEAEAAAEILGCQVAFWDFFMGECSATMASTRRMAAWIAESKPDFILTQWPVDTHPDHQVVGILPLRDYVFQKAYHLGFYEVYTGIQSISFQPNRHVDTTLVWERKLRAIRCHASQEPDELSRLT